MLVPKKDEQTNTISTNFTIFSGAIPQEVFIEEELFIWFRIFQYASKVCKDDCEFAIVTEHLAQHASLCFTPIHTGPGGNKRENSFAFCLVLSPCHVGTLSVRREIHKVKDHGGGVEMPVLQPRLHLRLQDHPPHLFWPSKEGDQVCSGAW